MSLIIVSNYDEENNIQVISPNGEIDLSTAEQFKSELKKATDEKITDILIDMSNLDYIDSSGLGIMIGTLKRLKLQNKDIYLKNVKDNVKKVFIITGLDKIFKMEV